VQNNGWQQAPRKELFETIWEETGQADGRPEQLPFPEAVPRSKVIPHLTEPWYC
jgi:hypothetical protein